VHSLRRQRRRVAPAPVDATLRRHDAGSPDHQKIAVVRSFPLDARTGTPEPRPRTVYVIDGDGTRLRLLGLLA
jgi:hypothetical protein